MSTLRLTTIANQSGSSSVPSDTVINGSAKAWVNFNGTGTVAIRASFNVSSITDNGTGDYTVNFTTAMSDANYSGQVCIGTLSTTDGVGGGSSAATLIAASFRIRTLNASQSTLKDFDAIYVAIFR